MFTVRRHEPKQSDQAIGAIGRPSPLRGHRRGLALMIVMVALGTSLVVTLAFVRTQNTMLQIRRNLQRGDLALQAAQTGAAVGLGRIHDVDWTGTSETLVRDVHSDSQGTSSYNVEFLPLGESSAAEDKGLRLVVTSTGTWQSLEHVDDRIEKTVEVEVRLLPRLPGRPINAGDSANAEDQLANEEWFADIQNYALFARGDSESYLRSLDMDPRTRIDGDVWSTKFVDHYEGPKWSAAIRQEYLKSLGNLYVDGSGAHYPHPFSGTLTFHTTPYSWTRTDLTDLQVPWSVATDVPAYEENVELSNWTPYVIYEGGFEYDAVVVSNSLSDVTLGPTAENPLGIFYCSSDMTLGNNVTIQGTLVCSGRVTIDGDSVELAAVNWRDSTGTAYVDNVDLWPRLPTIVATRVRIERESQASIDGAVYASVEFVGGGGDFRYSSAADVNITGTATSRVDAQPLSVVDLQNTPDLSSLNGDEDYAIWLEDGLSGTWHPIVGVDTANHSLSVVGEVVHTTPTNYRISRNRLEYVDIRGPLMTNRADINRPDEWGEISSSAWQERYDAWSTENDNRVGMGLAPIEFVDWLADADNLSLWGYPYDVYGLSHEPTFQLKHDGSTAYQWLPQLFEMYDGTGPDAEFAGYRWEVISWRESR